MQNSDNFITIAKITSSHGIKGEVKIFIYGEPKIFFNYENFYLKSDLSNPLKISFRGKKGNNAIATIESSQSRNDSELLKNQEIYLAKTELMSLPEDEFYINDLLELSVIGQDNKEIGKITAINNYKAGDILTIKFSNNKSSDFLLTEEIFQKIDLTNKTISFNPPEII